MESGIISEVIALGRKRRRKSEPSVGERLQAAYERVIARKGKK
jgi:hypothetical protein